MDNQVRIFRKNPIAWWDKNVMRYLRGKYGKDKKTFIMLRSVYLSLCEIESDFNDKPINFFTKTVGTYAGLSREAAGKYINLLIKEGLIKKVQIKDPKTNKFLGGTEVEILDLDSKMKSTKPLSGYPSNGVSQHRDTPTTIKNISISKKLNINVNENFKTFENRETERQNRGGETKSLKDLLTQYNLKIPKKVKNEAELPRKTYKINGGIDRDQRDYLASEMATKLSDQKSLGCFRTIAEKVPQQVIFQVLSSIKETDREGKIRVSRGALFVNIIQGYCESHGIELGFRTNNRSMGIL